MNLLKIVMLTQPVFKRSFSAEGVLKTQSGIFKTISESTPVEYCQKLLIEVHDKSGLPWWATMICTTVFLRSTITVPLALYQSLIMAKLENIKLEMGEIAKELGRETNMAVKMYKWDEKTARAAFARSAQKQWKQLIIRENCHPFKTVLLMLFQIPLWVSVSVSLRNLVYMLPEQNAIAQLKFLELSVGGFGWIPNLTQVDSSLILPVTLGLLNLSVIEFQTLIRTKEPTRFQRAITNVFRGVSILLVPIAAVVPSCVVLYWTTSSVFGLVQNLVLVSPKVKRTFRIPYCPSELEQPYQHLAVKIQNKFKST